MADYLEPPIEGDPTAKYATIVAYLQSVWPGWQPPTGHANLDDQIAIAVADLSASDEQTFSAASTDAFRWFGLNLVPDGQPEEAVAATSTVTIVPGTGAALQTIPAGTTYGIAVAGDLVGFEVVSDQTFASPAVNLTAVDVVADRTGTVGNDLTGALQQVDSLGFVASVTFEAPTSGGLDEEPTPTFLDRLRALLQLQAPRPIIPDNFAVMARNIAGVERAVAIDGYDPADHASYDPADPSTWKERFVTVSAIDAAGEDVGATIRGQIDTYFNGDATLGIRGKRETNFKVVVAAPTYTTIDVMWTAVAWPTWAPADVRAAGNAALSSYLSPSIWGQPTFGEQRGWENLRQVTIDGLYAVLRSVEGLRNVTALTFRIAGGSLAGTPVTLTGSPGPVLTRPGTMTGTVTS